MTSAAAAPANTRYNHGAELIPDRLPPGGPDPSQNHEADAIARRESAAKGNNNAK